MDARESALIERLIKSHEELRDEIHSEMAKMQRAVYGEPENKVPGILQRLAVVEESNGKLHEFKKRILWVWGAVVTFAIGGWELAGDHIKGLFK